MLARCFDVFYFLFCYVCFVLFCCLFVFQNGTQVTHLKFGSSIGIVSSTHYPAGIFDIDSMLNRRQNFDGHQKSVEKCKNTSTVVEKALKFRRRINVNISFFFLFGVEKALKI